MIQHLSNPAGGKWSQSNSDSTSGCFKCSAFDRDSFRTALPGQAFRAPAGHTIYREGKPCSAIFQISHGVARLVKQTDDGRRIVQSFCVPGDIFGMSCTNSYMATAEAVSDLHLMKFEQSQFYSRLDNDRTLARQLWNWLVRNSERVEQLRLLARLSSVEKLSYFLLDLAERIYRWTYRVLPQSVRSAAAFGSLHHPPRAGLGQRRATAAGRFSTRLREACKKDNGEVSCRAFC
jgi:CRP-like cAMP-binding protein